MKQITKRKKKHLEKLYIYLWLRGYLNHEWFIKIFWTDRFNVCSFYLLVMFILFYLLFLFFLCLIPSSSYRACPCPSVACLSLTPSSWSSCEACTLDSSCTSSCRLLQILFCSLHPCKCNRCRVLIYLSWYFSLWNAN